jgi:hypothetical protein
MRKLILAATTIAALAVPTIVPALASADVARYQSQTATFTVYQPQGQISQWSNVWTHAFTVNVNPCDHTFSGIAHQTGTQDGTSYDVIENVTGKFGANTVSFDASAPSDGVSFHVVGLPTDATDQYNGTVQTVESSWTANIVEMKATAPQFTNSSNYMNHGDYVSSQGGGSDAAHSCIGMPIH